MKPKPQTAIISLDGPKQRARTYREFTLNIFYLAANGLPPKQIASIMGISEKRTDFFLKSRRGRREIGELNWRMIGEKPEKAFEKLVPESIQIQAEIMRDPNEKGAVRVMAANAIQDRALGKPKQQVDINHKSTARQVLEFLENEQFRPDIAVEGRPVPLPALSSPDEVPEDFGPTQESVDGTNEARDDVDQWLSDNF